MSEKIINKEFLNFIKMLLLLGILTVLSKTLSTASE